MEKEVLEKRKKKYYWRGIAIVFTLLTLIYCIELLQERYSEDSTTKNSSPQSLQDR